MTSCYDAFAVGYDAFAVPFAVGHDALPVGRFLEPNLANEP